MHGTYDTNKHIYSEAQQREMWKPQTIMPIGNTKPYTSLFRTYGLGWRIEDINGHLQVSHTGGLDGIGNPNPYDS